MRIKSEYQIHSVAGKNLVIARGKKRKAFRILSLNLNAVWLWEQLAGVDFTEEDVIYLLLFRFDLDIEMDLPTIISDVRRWIDVLLRHDILEL